MRTYSFRRLRRLIVVAAFALMPCAVVSAAPTQPLSEKLILSLRYRGQVPLQKAASASPYGLGFYGYGDGINETGGAPSYRGEMAATDWQRNIYVVDPTNEKRQWLRQYNQRGQFIQKWPLASGDTTYDVDVTRDGVVWVSYTQHDGEPIKGLPIMAFKSKQQKPIVDWRQKIPTPLQNFILSRVKKNPPRSFDSQSRTNEMTCRSGPSCAVEEVKLRLRNRVSEDVKPGDGVRIHMIVKARSNGGNLVVIPDPDRDSVYLPNGYVSQLSPSGQEWFLQPDTYYGKWKWSQMWLWGPNRPKGQPLITLRKILQPQSWWQRTFAMSKKQGNPGLEVDGIGNIYQTWTKDSEAPARTFQLGDGPHLRGHLESEEGEKALVVLNPKRQIIGYLPWRTSYWELFEKWISPVPDGSGFYRQEFTEKELRIYWHPLPNFKSAASRNVLGKKR